MQKEGQMNGKTKGLLAVGAAAGLVLAAGLDVRLAVRRYGVESGKLEEPVKLALLSDLHACRYGKGQRTLLKAVAAQRPDAVVMCGDMVDDEPRMEEWRALLTVRELARRWPVYCATGNHEHRTGRLAQIKGLLEDCGAVVLDGRCLTVLAGREMLQLAGVDDPETGEENWQRQLDAAGAGLDGRHFSILLTHRPERVADYAAAGFDLVLAGHAHGGQWRIPGLINGLLAPNQGLFPAYAGGRYETGGTTLIVSRGLARESTLIPRFFNRPELVVVELTPPAKKL